jgi:hypothetical protein
MNGSRNVWLGAILYLSALAAAFLWFPISRIGTYNSINYNEGWNTYRQQMAAQGSMLYALPPDYAATNYPPLSFHLVGLLGKLTGDVTIAGRWLSLISLAAIAVLIALLTLRASGIGRLGVYAAILFVTWLTVMLPDRVGMNDPHLFGLAFSVLGLYLYVRNPESETALVLSAVAFAIALFIKQSLIAFPAAVAVHLAISGTLRRIAIWAAWMAVLGGIFFFVTVRWDGEFFWSHLMTPRAYSFLHGWENLKNYLLRYQVAFLIGLVWSIWNLRAHGRDFFSITFAVANAVGWWFAGGDGVVTNVLFEALVVLAVVTTLAIADLEPFVAKLRFGKVLLPILLAAPAFGCLILLPEQYQEDRLVAATRPDREAEAAQAVEFLKARPGAALCENLLLCYEAGKPMLYDAFFVDSQMRVGRLAGADIARMISGGQFRTIQIDLAADETLLPMRRLRFTSELMRAMAEHYKPAFRASNFAILVPANEP